MDWGEGWITQTEPWRPPGRLTGRMQVSAGQPDSQGGSLGVDGETQFLAQSPGKG